MKLQLIVIFVSIMTVAVFSADDQDREKRQVKSPAKKVGVLVETVVGGVLKMCGNIIGSGDLAGGGEGGPTPPPTPATRPTPADGPGPTPTPQPPLLDETINITSSSSETSSIDEMDNRSISQIDDEENEDPQGWCIRPPTPAPPSPEPGPHINVLSERALPFSPAVRHVMDFQCTPEQLELQTQSIDGLRAQIAPMEQNIEDVQDRLSQDIAQRVVEIDRFRHPHQHPETQVERRARLTHQNKIRAECTAIRNEREPRIAQLIETAAEFQRRLDEAYLIRDAMVVGIDYRAAYPHHSFAVFMTSDNTPTVQRHRPQPIYTPKKKTKKPNERKRRNHAEWTNALHIQDVQVFSTEDIVREMAALQPNSMKVFVFSKHRDDDEEELRRKLAGDLNLLELSRNLTTELIDGYYGGKRYYKKKLLEMSNHYNHFKGMMQDRNLSYKIRIAKVMEARSVLHSMTNKNLMWYYDIEKVFRLAADAFTFDQTYDFNDATPRSELKRFV